MGMCQYCGYETLPERSWHERGDCGISIAERLSYNDVSIHQSLAHITSMLAETIVRINALEFVVKDIRKKMEKKEDDQV